jgi:hypothetical protein
MDLEKIMVWVAVGSSVLAWARGSKDRVYKE